MVFVVAALVVVERDSPGFGHCVRLTVTEQGALARATDDWEDVFNVLKIWLSKTGFMGMKIAADDVRVEPQTREARKRASD